jgi:hypothetical protein
LQLDDIDWKAGQLSVHGKSGHRNKLPLPADVGRAIAAYLKSGRPPSTSRSVFLRARAPACGFQGAAPLGRSCGHVVELQGRYFNRTHPQSGCRQRAG